MKKISRFLLTATPATPVTPEFVTQYVRELGVLPEDKLRELQQSLENFKGVVALSLVGKRRKIDFYDYQTVMAQIGGKTLEEFFNKIVTSLIENY